MLATKTIPKLHRWRRTKAKRQVDENLEVVEKINDGENIVFYVGFKLDGHRVYEDLTVALPHYAEFNVYINPTIEPLTDGTLVYRPYWPHNDKVIDIKVFIYDTKYN